MDWTIVVSTAITGAVGIAGVAGTIIAARIAGNSARESARLSINAEDRRARLADKRQLYAHALVVLHAAVDAAQEVAIYGDNMPGKSAAAQRARKETVRAALDATTEIELIAPPAVWQLATQAFSALLRPGDEEMAELVALVTQLSQAMWADLNEAQAADLRKDES